MSSSSNSNSNRNTNDEDDRNKNKKTGKWISISLGIAAGLTVIILFIVYFRKHLKQKKQESLIYKQNIATFQEFQQAVKNLQPGEYIQDQRLCDAAKRHYGFKSSRCR